MNAPFDSIPTFTSSGVSDRVKRFVDRHPGFSSDPRCMKKVIRMMASAMGDLYHDKFNACWWMVFGNVATIYRMLKFCKKMFSVHVHHNVSRVLVERVNAKEPKSIFTIVHADASYTIFDDKSVKRIDKESESLRIPLSEFQVSNIRLNCPNATLAVFDGYLVITRRYKNTIYGQ